MKNSLTKQITYTGIMTALVFLSTSIIKVPLPYTGGYVHIGDSMVFISGILLGRKRGFFAAGVGSAFSDIFLGYTAWALPTLIIKGLMAWIIGYVYSKRNSLKTISTLTVIYISMWGVFHFAIRKVLNSSISNVSLIEDLEGINTEQQLTNLIHSVELKLLIASLCLPFIVILILIVLNKKKNLGLSLSSLIGFVVAGSFMVLMYYLTEFILYGNYIIPIFTIPMNILQFSIGLIIAEILIPIIQKTTEINP